MKNRIIGFIILILVLSQSVYALNMFDVRELGVVPDAGKVVTAELQAALDEVSHRGGGILNFGKGEYVTGTLNIPSHVGIYLESDARILGSIDPFDYSGYAPGDS